MTYRNKERIAFTISLVLGCVGIVVFLLIILPRVNPNKEVEHDKITIGQRNFIVHEFKLKDGVSCVSLHPHPGYEVLGISCNWNNQNE